MVDRLRSRPLLLVITGPSGVGKDSVIARMKGKKLPFHYVVTATTRPALRITASSPADLITIAIPYAAIGPRMAFSRSAVTSSTA